MEALFNIQQPPLPPPKVGTLIQGILKRSGKQGHMVQLEVPNLYDRKVRTDPRNPEFDNGTPISARVSRTLKAYIEVSDLQPINLSEL